MDVRSILPGIINNTALVLALGLLYDIFLLKKEIKNKIIQIVGNGLILSLITVAVMLNPVSLEEGLVFDTRAIVLGIGGLFFGTLPSIIAMLFASIYRIWIGGQGIYMGVASILSSGTIGILWRIQSKKPVEELSWKSLFCCGLAINMTVLFDSIFLPTELWGIVRRVMGPVFITLYPLGFLLLAILMQSRLKSKKIEKQLKQSEYRILNYFNAAPDGIFITDKTGSFLEMNQAVCRITGYSKEELYAQPISLLYTEEEKEKIACFVKKTIKNSHATDDFTLIKKNGSHRIVSVDSVLFEDNNILSFTKDISEKVKAVEQKLSLSRELESLWGLAMIKEKSINEISDYVLEEMKKITGSSCGFYGTVKKEGELLQIHSCSEDFFDTKILKQDHIFEMKNKSTPWFHLLNNKEILLDNSYDKPNGEMNWLRKGFSVQKLLCVPVLSNERCVALGAVLNKKDDYSLNDAKLLENFLRSVQIIINRRNLMIDLKRSINEKDILLKELYHRTKNNMQVISSMLQLQGLKYNEPAVDNVIEDTVAKIQAIALVHQKLYQSKDLTNIQLKTYLSDLFNLVLGSFDFNEKNIKVFFKGEDFPVIIDIAVPCGLIINELLTNTLKYAFPEKRQGIIEISTNRNLDGTITLCYRDNGKGLKNDLDLNSLESLGLKTIFNLVKHQLNGSIRYFNKNGLEWQIVFNETVYNKRI